MCSFNNIHWAFWIQLVAKMKQTTLYINYSLMVLFTVYTVIKNTKSLMITWKLHAQQIIVSNLPKKHLKSQRKEMADRKCWIWIYFWYLKFHFKLFKISTLLICTLYRGRCTDHMVLLWDCNQKSMNSIITRWYGNCMELLEIRSIPISDAAVSMNDMGIVWDFTKHM